MFCRQQDGLFPARSRSVADNGLPIISRCSTCSGVQQQTIWSDLEYMPFASVCNCMDAIGVFRAISLRVKCIIEQGSRRMGPPTHSLANMFSFSASFSYFHYDSCMNRSELHSQKGKQHERARAANPKNNINNVSAQTIFYISILCWDKMPR